MRRHKSGNELSPVIAPLVEMRFAQTAANLSV